MLGGKAKTSDSAGKHFELPDYLRDDAFALRVGEQRAVLEGGKAPESFIASKRAIRLKCLICAIIVLGLTAFSLCIDMYGTVSRSLPDAIYTLVTWAGFEVSRLFDLPFYADVSSLGDIAPLYLDVIERAGMTLAALVCGSLLAVAGMLYQIVFRNPIASPSLLGITNGVQLGLLAMFVVFGTVSAQQVPQRFMFGYVGGIATLLIVFALSKVITKPKAPVSVFDMLVIGTIVSTFLGAACKYALQALSAVDLWTVFFEFQEGLDIYLDPATYIVLVGAVAVSLVPVALLRFRLNMLSFSDGEARLLGGNPRAMRALSLTAGSLMILTAQVFVGPASSFALVIPFVSRLLFGSEFGKQLWGNVLLGMIVLLLCRDLSSLIPFVGIGIPIGTIAGVITVPVFIWAITFAKQAWSQ